jgi:hypothetical protein
MTDRQGKVFVAAFMTVTLGMVCAGIALPFWLHDSRWVALCLAIIFYL